MTSPIPFDGGPAFPIPAGTTTPFIGMTLRDWFAGQALPQVLHQIATTCKPEVITPALVARDAYLAADAMIAERAKGQK